MQLEKQEDKQLKKLTLEGFEEYQAGKITTKSVPQFTISKGGRLTISRSACEAYFHTAKYVTVFYDKDRQIIALKLSKKPDITAGKICGKVTCQKVRHGVA